MKVLEIKNNLIKVSYDTEDKLVLAGFVVIEDEKSPYVAQIVSLKADNGISYAIAKLMFTFDSEGIVKNYDGSIPQLNAKATKLTCEELLDILPIKTPLKLGNIAQQNFLLNVDVSMLENNTLICSDSAKNTAILLSNFAKQLENRAESSIIFDIDGKYENQKKLVFGKDFKLPLNFETINFIYANDLNDIDPTSKAVIQDIFLEVQEYTRTIPDRFIPFDTFIEVVSQQYNESNIPELALLKNKLLKYKEENVFAQSKYEVTGLKEYIKDNYSTILDISNVEAKMQREIISYVYSVLDELGGYICSFVKVNDANSDKKLLKMLLNENKIYTSIICNHNYKYIYELKEKADNLILFAPETTQHDFASYNTFLNKLNHDEFVVWGKATQRIPLIVELAPVEIIKDEPEDDDIVQEPAKDTTDNQVSPVEQSEIKPDFQEENTAGPETETISAAPAAPPEPDFTENEDTYTDLSDDIERKPVEEEDFSALSASEEVIEINEDEEEDDFDDELNKSEPYHTSENTAQNDFFNKTAELLKEPEITEPDEEILMADGEVIVDEEIEDSEKSSDEFVTPFESSNQEVETEQIVLPAPEIDERIEEDLQSVVTEKAIDEQENDNGLNTQTPYENSYVAEPAPLIPDDEAINDDLIEQVARDVDKNFIYSKIERENLDDEDSSDVLTEDDLNFIDDINQGENDILEPVSDEPDNFEDSEDSSNYQEKEEQTPVVPVYPAETPTAQQSFEQGDHVSHPKYGEGIVEKMIKYGNKTLCSINFVNVGRRLLDPAISEISKV